MQSHIQSLQCQSPIALLFSKGINNRYGGSIDSKKSLQSKKVQGHIPPALSFSTETGWLAQGKNHARHLRVFQIVLKGRSKAQRRADVKAHKNSKHQVRHHLDRRSIIHRKKNIDVNRVPSCDDI